MDLTLCHLDFETYCNLDIKRHGAARYFADPSFRVLMSAWAFDDGPVQQCEGMVPIWTWDPLPDLFHAFNASFEIACLRHHGVQIALHRWRDTMVHAYARGFSGGLKDVGNQLNLPFALRKMDEGGRLIGKFSKPQSNGRVWTKEDTPEDWDLFMQYNRLDVEAERAIARILDKWPWTIEEQHLWEWDYAINRRGVPVDMDLVHKAIETAETMAQETNAQVKALTGGVSASQVGKLLEWCRAQGYTGADLRKETVEQYFNSKN